MGWYFNLVIVGLFTFLLGVVPLVTKAMRAGLDPRVGYRAMGFFLVVVGLIFRWLLRVKRDAPERVVGFLQRMGLYRYRG